MMKRTRSRLSNGRNRPGYGKPTLVDGYEARPRLHNVQQNYEKYVSLARDALTSGDRIAAEGFYQHAEHFLRLMNEYKAHFQERNEQQAVRGEGLQEPINAESQGTSSSSIDNNTQEDMLSEQLVA